MIVDWTVCKRAKVTGFMVGFSTHDCFIQGKRILTKRSIFLDIEQHWNCNSRGDWAIFEMFPLIIQRQLTIWPPPTTYTCVFVHWKYKLFEMNQRKNISKSQNVATTLLLKNTCELSNRKKWRYIDLFFSKRESRIVIALPPECLPEAAVVAWLAGAVVWLVRGSCAFKTFHFDWLIEIGETLIPSHNYIPIHFK